MAEGRGERVAICYQDQQITYRQVYEMVNRFGNALLNLGVEMENRVFLLLPDSPELVYGYFGAMKIGAVPIPVNNRLTEGDYVYMRIHEITHRHAHYYHKIFPRTPRGGGGGSKRPFATGP